MIPLRSLVDIQQVHQHLNDIASRYRGFAIECVILSVVCVEAEEDSPLAVLERDGGDHAWKSRGRHATRPVRLIQQRAWPVVSEAQESVFMSDVQSLVPGSYCPAKYKHVGGV